MSNSATSRRAVLYGRVSKLTKADQTRAGLDGGEGKSVDQQLDELRRLADRDQVEVVATHRDDGVSASRYGRGRAREGWQDVMTAIVGGEVTELWVWEISRATRDRPVWASLINACIAQLVMVTVAGKVHDPTDPDDGFMLDLMAALAVRESAMTSKRIKRNVRAAADAGLPHGRIPYGYRRIYDERTRALVRQEPDPDTGPIVAEIFARTVDDHAAYAIAQDLNSRGVPTPHEVRAARLGQDVTQPYPWTLEQVLRIVRNPTYAGLRAHNEGGLKPGARATIVGPAAWNGIVARETWEHAQLIVERPGRRTTHDLAVKHLLSGIAVCGVCGSVCRVTKNRGYLSYACWGMPEKRGTGCVTRLQKPVDAYVTERVLRRLAERDVVALFRPDGTDDEVADAGREHKRLEARLEEFRQSADHPDGISAASLARAERSLEPLIAAARARSIPRSVPPLIRAALEAPDVRVWWNGQEGKPETALPIADRRFVIRTLVTVTIRKSPYRNGVRGFDPSLIAVEPLAAARGPHRDGGGVE